MFTSIRLHGLIAILVATGLGATAVPAFAKDAAGADSKTRLTVEQKNGQTVYCMSQSATTGTILTTKTCHTRAEWADKGLVIPDQQRAAEGNGQNPAS